MKTLLIISIIVVAIALISYMVYAQISLTELYIKLFFRKHSIIDIQTSFDSSGYYKMIQEQRKLHINRVKELDAILKKIESATEINNNHSQSGNYANEILFNR
jgi:predicted Holliday junction resolvase-like endonuclease